MKRILASLVLFAGLAASCLADAIYTGVTHDFTNTFYAPIGTLKAHCTYTVSIQATLTLTTGQAADVYLEASADGSTGWYEIAHVGYSKTGVLALGLSQTDTVILQLTGWMPYQQYMRLRKTGTATVTYLNGIEHCFD